MRGDGLRLPAVPALLVRVDEAEACLTICPPGEINASQVTCVLCLHSPCDCPAFGTPEYAALIDARHGRQS